MMKEITIYTTSWCPYCAKAKRYLEQEGYQFKEVDIEREGISRKHLSKIGKWMTVPQIIIDGKPIGGYDDLIRLMARSAISAVRPRTTRPGFPGRGLLALLWGRPCGWCRPRWSGR